jgi:hypothetical protein
MNMLEMAKLVGNQAIKKPRKSRPASSRKRRSREPARKRRSRPARAKQGKETSREEGGDGRGADPEAEGDRSARPAPASRRHEEALAVVHNTLGLVELKKKNISPAIKQFKEAGQPQPELRPRRA